MTPALCPNGASTCRGGERRPYRRPLTRGAIALLCDQCVESLRQMGMEFLPAERRVADVPVDHERRGFRPAWLRRNNARDFTGRLVA